MSKQNYEENDSFTKALRKGIICETVSEDNENSRMPSRAPFNLGDNKAYLGNSSLSLFLRIKKTPHFVVSRPTRFFRSG